MSRQFRLAVERIKQWWPDRTPWSMVGAALAALAIVVSLAWGVWYIYQTTPAALTEGRVIDRSFVPAHEEQYMQAHYRTESYTTTQCTTSGGYGDQPSRTSCHPVTRTRTVTYYVPAWRHVPDDWDIRIDGCSQNRRGDTICRREWIDVSEDEHDMCRIGLTWRRETACLPQ